MEILLSWKLIRLKIFKSQYSEQFLSSAWEREMKDSLIYITHEQNPEPIFAKAIKNFKPLAQQKENHDVINEKEMDGKCDTSFHLLWSLSLSNTDMERQASPKEKQVLQALLQEDSNSGIYALKILIIYIYFSNIVLCKWDV